VIKRLKNVGGNGGFTMGKTEIKPYGVEK